MTGPDDLKLQHCPALVTIQVLAGKWKTRILWELRDGPQRFGALKRRLRGVSPKVLTQHLQQLELDGLITRTVEPIGKVDATSYAYSEYGRSLIPVLNAVGDWGVSHQGREPQQI